MNSAVISHKARTAAYLFALLITVLMCTACSGETHQNGYTTNEETKVILQTERGGTDAATEWKDTERTTNGETGVIMNMRIGDTAVAVEWEDNGSVRALKDLCKKGPLTVTTSLYGGFEQVGSLGTSLPRNDVRTTAQAGDIFLYSGDQIVVFFGSNTWEYTRLGKIRGMDNEELRDLLGAGSVRLQLFVE